LVIRFFLYTAIACVLASPVAAAGIQLLDSPGHAGAIWYPCAAQATEVPLGPLTPPGDVMLVGVQDCPVTGAKRPLIILSHGRGGWFGQHHDTAEALADAGFVVAAINHPGDTVNDTSRSDTMSVWTSRPADIVRLLDFILGDWTGKQAIDPARVGFFGFSLGGYTGLVLIGGTADFRRRVNICKEEDDTESCVRARNGDVPPSPQRDPRIKAAVIADAAMSWAFNRQLLGGITIPLQVWRSELGGHGVQAQFTSLTASQLPGPPDVHTVAAGHYAFLAPCSPELASSVPRVCTDEPPTFDRAAFHRDFNAALVHFFQERLGEQRDAR
jgi:predicted dienelactone hydrolase